MKLQWTSRELADQDLEVWFKPYGAKTHGLIPFPFFIDLPAKRLEYVSVKIPTTLLERVEKVDPKKPPELTPETELDTHVITATGEIVICKSDKTVVASTDPKLVK